MSMYAQTSIVLVVMGAVFAICFSLKKTRHLPVGLIMIMASIGGAIAYYATTGYSFPWIRNFVEGLYYFFYLMLVVTAGMIFIKVMQLSGSFDALTRLLVATFHRQPAILLGILMVIIMFPAMITGSAPVAVVTTGALVAPLLLHMGIPKLETAAIISMGALFGQSAPPVNVMIMIICTSVFMPYEGFDLPLSVLCFPLAIFSILYLGRKFVELPTLEKMVAEEAPARQTEGGFKIFLPLIVLVILMVAPRVFKVTFPDPSMPLTFMISAIVGLFVGKKVSFITACKEAMAEASTLLGLFLGLGVMIQIMSLTGARGLMAIAIIGLPRLLLYLSSTIGSTLICGPLVPFGAAAVVGPPIVLAFVDKQAIISSSAISMFLSLGCLIPPTALGSLFAARVVGVENYLLVTKRCWFPALITAIVALLFLIYANQIARVL